jgi:hypothetical protein
MLTESDIEAFFAVNEVYGRDPEAGEQHLERVLGVIASARAEHLGRDAGQEDLLFAALAICLPMFRQKRSYTAFMQERRRAWFPPFVDAAERDRRAALFFDASLFDLSGGELQALVDDESAVDLIQPYLGTFGESGLLLG